MKLLQEFIDNKKLYYAYEYTLNYIYTIIRMFTGYRIRSIFLLVLLFLFSILIFFFYKEFYTLILKDPLLGISLILILWESWSSALCPRLRQGPFRRPEYARPPRQD